MKIIVSSLQYPTYGGAATVAYAMIKYLRNINIDTCGLFFNKSSVFDYDPDKIGGIFLAKYKYRSNEIYTNGSIDESKAGINNFNENLIMDVKISINNYLKGNPSLILCIGNNIASFNKAIYPNVKIIMFVAGVVYSRYYANRNLSIRDYLKLDNVIVKLKQTSYALHEIDDIKSSHKIIPNSDLMLEAYNKIYPEYKDKICQDIFDTSNLVNCLLKSDDLMTSINNNVTKDIDVIIICSNLNRLEKNVMFLKPLLKKYDNYKKCLIGENNENYLDLDNTILTGFVPYLKVHEYLSRSKLLILPSLCESAGNVVREAVKNKCLVLTSNNVGFYKCFPEISICNTFEIEQWEQKMTRLIINYSSIIKDYEINFNNKLKNMKQLDLSNIIFDT